MDNINKIINESGLSKVSVAKYLGVSRQMLYNYLALDSFGELPKDKQNKILLLLGVEKESDIKNIHVDENYINRLESKINDSLIDSLNHDSISDLKGLNKKEQEILTDIFNLLKDKLLDNDINDSYTTLKYLYYYMQRMDQVPELKYTLAYMNKSNGLIPALEFAYDEDKQYTYEGILYSAMTLYSNGGASYSKISESHQKFEKEIESKKEEKLSRTQELNSFKSLALQELGYSSINEENAKEVFEKIAELMSSKF